MTALQFPLDVQNGQLGMVSSTRAAQQLVLAIARTAPGELPLSRDYGIAIDYNVTHEMARQMQGAVLDAIRRWYPTIDLTAAHVSLSDEGREARMSVDLGVKEI